MALSNLSDSMLRGVGATAIGVAVIRARETDHPNGLVNDPLAAALAAAARQGFVEKAGPDAWSKLEQTAEMFHDGGSWRFASSTTNYRLLWSPGCDRS